MRWCSAPSRTASASASRARSAQTFDPNDVATGRTYVAAYVPYVHYVERLYADAAGTGPSYPHAPQSAAAHGAHADAEHPAAQHAR